ncbi:transcriptional regulator with XRE-family HTH domain [Pseudonocardia eucalypti]|nr:transcriptional regulator with XRE-family HTH domain [Pseudonocardia eucalypti]
MLGAQLRRLRELKGMSRQHAGEMIHASEAKISRLELGRIGQQTREVADLLTLYGVQNGRQRDALLSLARQATTPDWWNRYSDVLPAWFETYIGLEQAASTIRSYQVHCVPGLFQTADYARAVIRLGYPNASMDEIDQRVDLRLARQDILTSAQGPMVWMVVDEVALRRPFGDPSVMQAQLGHLLDLSELPNVTLQTVPFHAGGYAAAGGPFIVLRFADPDVADIVYLEQLTSALYLDKPVDVDIYAMVIDRISAAAISAAETRSLLVKLIEEQ